MTEISCLYSSSPLPPPQAIILRYAPIVGPIIGSAFIIGLYMAARLVRGDLTDRMAMVNQVRGVGGSLYMVNQVRGRGGERENRGVLLSINRITQALHTPPSTFPLHPAHPLFYIPEPRRRMRKRSVPTALKEGVKP